MSQRNVEWVIGRLVTDEEFREAYAGNAQGVLAGLVDAGTELTPCEVRVLAAFDLRVADRCAQAIDPRLQKANLKPAPACPACDPARRSE